MRRRNLESNAYIFREGDAADRAYLLLEGEVAFFQGRDRIMDVGKGRFFGDLQLFKQGAYPATAITLKDSIVLEFTADELLEHLCSDQEALRSYLIGVEDRVEELLEMMMQSKKRT